MSKRLFFKTKEQRTREAAQKKERAEAKLRDRSLRNQSKWFADRISRGLAQMGIVHELPARRRPTIAQSLILRLFGMKYSGRQTLQFLSARYEPNAIYFEIDTMAIPHPHNIDDISSEAVLRTLSAHCRRKVTFEGEITGIPPENGSWYVVFLNGAVAGIPKKFKFADAILNTQASASPLWYIVGLTHNRKLIHDDLSLMPNWLIAGSTRTGKSVHLRSFLLQILIRNSPDTVKLFMIDLKGGTEFKAFRKLPHLWKGKPIVSKNSQLISALKEYFAELKRRQAELAHSGLYDIVGWNKRHPEDKWPYIILVFDEVAQALRDPNRKFAKKVEALLGNIMAVSAATGGHAILCTQRPSSDVVTGFLKTNLSGRTCFAVPDYPSSKVILESTEAALIDPKHRGRAIHMRGPEKILVQTPKVTDRILARGVKAILHKWSAPKGPGNEIVTMSEILDYALHNLDGSLSRRLLLQVFKRRGLSRPKLEDMIASFDGQPAEINGQFYKIVNLGPPKGYRLTLIEPEISSPNDTGSW